MPYVATRPPTEVLSPTRRLDTTRHFAGFSCWRP